MREVTLRYPNKTKTRVKIKRKVKESAYTSEFPGVVAGLIDRCLEVGYKYILAGTAILLTAHIASKLIYN